MSINNLKYLDVLVCQTMLPSTHSLIYFSALCICPLAVVMLLWKSHMNQKPTCNPFEEICIDSLVLVEVIFFPYSQFIVWFDARAMKYFVHVVDNK